MSVPFSRSLYSVKRDRSRATSITLVVAALLGVTWTAWLFFGSISRYAVTDTARLEAEQQAHPIYVLTTGVVVASHMALSQQVGRGELLVELESVDMQFDLVSLQARRAGLIRQITSTRKEIEAQTRALRDGQIAGQAALAEARARVREAQAAETVAYRHAARTQEVFEYGHVSEAERDVAVGQAKERHASAQAVSAAVERMDRDRRLRQSEKEAQIAELERDLGRFETDLGSVEATLAHVEHDRQHSFVVAPVAGHVAEIVPLQPGAIVHDGDRIGTVIPSGPLRVVATFPADQAIGRIRPGQAARVRLRSFPWVQFGTLAATVSRVATEGRDGGVRVELAVSETGTFPAPLEHGLLGALEVEVERVAPITLVMRMIGRSVDRPMPEEPPGQEPVAKR